MRRRRRRRRPTHERGTLDVVVDDRLSSLRHASQHAFEDLNLPREGRGVRQSREVFCVAHHGRRRVQDRLHEGHVRREVGQTRTALRERGLSTSTSTFTSTSTSTSTSTMSGCRYGPAPYGVQHRLGQSVTEGGRYRRRRRYVVVVPGDGTTKQSKQDRLFSQVRYIPSKLLADAPRELFALALLQQFYVHVGHQFLDHSVQNLTTTEKGGE